MAKSAPLKPDPWSLTCRDGLVASRHLLTEEGQWKGRTWLQSGVVGTTRLVLPRPTNTPMPDTTFVENAVKQMLDGVDPRETLPCAIASIVDLRHTRIAELRARLQGDVSGQPFRADAAAVQKLFAGERDHGARSEVDTNIQHWATLAIRRIDGATVTEIVAGEHRDESHTRDHLREVEKRLAAAGVVPWAVWPAGRVPRDWHEAGELVGALERWEADGLAITAQEQIVGWLWERCAESCRVVSTAMDDALSAAFAGVDAESVLSAFRTSCARAA